MTRNSKTMFSSAGKGARLLGSAPISLSLNQEAAIVLLHCLSYGEYAVSQDDESSGVGKVIRENVNLIRKQINDKLSECLIRKAASEVKE